MGGGPEGTARAGDAPWVLVDAVQQLASARTIADVQAITSRAARRLCGADGAAFVLREGDVCHYADEDAIGPLWKGRRFPAATCVSGLAMRERRPVVIEDIALDDRVPQEAYRPTFVRSLAIVPVRSADPVAAIGNYWAEPRATSERELELLQALADSTALALENVALLGDLDRRVEDRTAELSRSLVVNERILRSLAHEIRNALTASAGLLTLAIRRDDLSDRDRELVELAARAVADGGRFVEEQLNAARDRAGELRPLPEDVEIAVLLDEVRSLHDELRRSDRVLLTMSHDDCPPVVRCDPHLLRLALGNLVGNALKFTDQGSVHLAAAQTGGTLVFSVRDTGVGIDPADHERIFAEWSQASGDRRGSGLGLPFVRRIAELLGGEVRVESTPGVGSLFTLCLPLEQVEPAALAA